jgi:hypothetical protein
MSVPKKVPVQKLKPVYLSFGSLLKELGPDAAAVEAYIAAHPDVAELQAQAIAVGKAAILAWLGSLVATPAPAPPAPAA